MLSLVFLLGNVIAQQKIVTGKVTGAEDGLPLPGVSVKVKGTNQGTATDINGNYTISASKGQVLVFSFIGSTTQEKTIGDTKNINIKMGSDTKSLDEVVVVGYGTQRKANLTGAVSTVDKKALESRPITDIGRGLQGAVPGLTVTTASGDISSEPKIRLRGVTGSLNTSSDGAKPLILVDNVEIPSLQMVNPEDIESISVLKDAASTSIYGTRGAWGVILITTKSGKKGASADRITYSNNISFATPTSMPKIASGYDNAMAALTAYRRSDQNAMDLGEPLVGMSVNLESIKKMKEWEELYGHMNLSDSMVLGRDFEIKGKQLYFYRSWDPVKKFVDNWAPQQKHDLNISGGSEKLGYNLGLGYLSQDGVLKVNPDKFNRYNLTLSLNSTVNKWFDARAKILYSNTRFTTPFSFSAGEHYSAWYYLFRWPAYYPYGTYQGKPFRSAITEAQQAKQDETKNAFARMSVGSTLKLSKGLTLDVDYTYSNTNSHLHQTGGGVEAYDFWAFNGTGLDFKNYYSGTSYDKARYNSTWSEVNTGKLFATYLKDFNDHSLKFILGGDIEKFTFNDQSSERRKLLDPSKGELNLATGDQFVGGAANHWSTLGFFGRVNYSYKNKYLLELNGRYDGSSRFPQTELWGFFPSISAGYVISEEGFMSNTKDIISFLKLRASYGSIGNQAVGEYRFLSLMDQKASNWILPGINNPTFTTPSPVSQSLTWEKVNTLDIGADVRVLNDKVGLTFDWYQRITKDMITPGVTLPNSFGSEPPVRNYGELEAKGWEVAIDFNHRFDNQLKLFASASLTDAQEKITRYSNVTKSIPGPISAINTLYYEGMKIGEIWGYETDRLFQEDDFIISELPNGTKAYKLKEGLPSQKALEVGSGFNYIPGDVKLKDLDGSGDITPGDAVYNSGDRKIIGNSTPRYQYGFRLGAEWKGIDLDAYFQGVGKRDLWASGSVFIPGFRYNEAWYSHQLDYWTPENTDAFYPRPASYGAVADKWDFVPQTRYLLNMAYLRMKNVTLGYSFPAPLVNKVNMQKVRIYLSGENLFEFDKLGKKMPLDPEVDFTQAQLNRDRAGFGRVYPYRRSFSFGLQATF